MQNMSRPLKLSFTDSIYRKLVYFQFSFHEIENISLGKDDRHLVISKFNYCSMESRRCGHAYTRESFLIVLDKYKHNFTIISWYLQLELINVT